MRHELLMPKLGLTMTEGALVEWMVAAGQPFRQGQSLFVIESEKAAIEVPAEHDGVLLECSAQPGQTLPVGAVIGWWNDGQQEQQAAATPSAPAVAQAPAHRASTNPRIPVTPLARRLALQRDIDLAQVRGSGPRGRIRAADLPQIAPARDGGAPVAATAAVALPAARAASGTLQRPSSIEFTIAQRLVAAKQQIPHFYLSAEVEVSALQSLRAELNGAQDGVRFTLNDFLLAAVGRALAEQAHLNRVWTEDGILNLASTDVGMAVNTERGLWAPVLRDVGRLPLADVSRAARALIERARTARLGAAEMAGGAITVSNAGMHDVSAMASIINPGQAMILGVGSVRELFRPDSAGQPSLRREIGLVLSADHRVLDGAAASGFLKCVRRHLSHPLGLLVA